MFRIQDATQYWVWMWEVFFVLSSSSSSLISLHCSQVFNFDWNKHRRRRRWRAKNNWKKFWIKVKANCSLDILTHFDIHNKIQLVYQHICDYSRRSWFCIRSPSTCLSVHLGPLDSQLFDHKLYYLVCTFHRHNRTQLFGRIFLSEQLRKFINKPNK